MLYLNLGLLFQIIIMHITNILQIILFFEYHRQSTLLKRNVLGDMTCALTTQSESDDDLLSKS